MTLINRLGSKVNTDKFRIREFDFYGSQFKVIVPLVGEAKLLLDKKKEIPESKIEEIYQNLTAEIKRDDIKQDEGINFLDNDIVVNGNSMREMAKMQASFENDIILSFKLLVPEEGQTMDDVTYEEICEIFPVAVQIEFAKRIADVISIDYNVAKKN